MDETGSVESPDAQPSTIATATAPLSNADVDNILSSSGRNRQRIRKACYPCNKRKIKCDRDERVPCGNCAKRPHPELCTFDDHAPRSVPPRSRTSNGHTRSSPYSASIARPRQFPQTPDQQGLLHGIHSASAAYDRENHSNGQSNGYSTWAAESRAKDETALREVGMQVSNGPEYSHAPSSGFQSVNAPSSNGTQRVAIANRPAWDFAPPRSEPSTFWDRISPLLPPQKHLLRFFDIYRTLCNPLYPVISDFDEFEAAVVNYIDDAASYRLRAELEGLKGAAFELRLSWLALLSATIATGIQYSDVKPAERRVLIEGFIKSTMQLLSYANYILCPNESSIMALLLVTRILQNDFQPEAAWSIIGMVTRMAESIGLQTPNYSVNVDIRTRESDTSRRRKLWWAVLWQESQLTMCFGRPASLDAKDPPSPSTSPGSSNLTYIDCMYSLCQYAVSAQHEHACCSTPPDRSTFSRSIDAIAAVRIIHEQALPRLSDKQKCRSIQERIEYFAFRIHQGFVVSFLSRLLMKSGLRLDQHQWDSLLQICRSSAIDCLQAYLDMQSFSVVPMRSWTLTFTALSSALLLGSVGNASTDDEDTVRHLQHKLLNLLRAGEDEDPDLTRMLSWWGRYKSAVAMLNDMSEQPSKELSATDTEIARERFLDPQRLWQEFFSTTSMNERDHGHGGSAMPQQISFGL